MTDSPAAVLKAAGQASRGRRNRRPRTRHALVAAVSYAERDAVLAQFGWEAAAELEADLGRAFAAQLGAWPLHADGGTVLVIPGLSTGVAEAALGRARAAVSAIGLRAGSVTVTVTPVVGYASARGVDLPSAATRADEALASAVSRMDLVPVAWTPPAREVRTSGFGAATRGWRDRHRLLLQILLTFALALIPPYLLYVLAGRLHAAKPVETVAYLGVTFALLGTAMSIYAEAFSALDPRRPPEQPASDAPPASAIIAAYLPNEAATVVETVKVFLALAYQPGLQVILAYNTPEPLPVEHELAELALQHEGLVLLKVEGSTSKAQNVNAALRLVTGEIVGIFDADHHPAPGAFDRAWRWISHGYGVVQGHCVIRNGDRSWISRTVAVEFESIYALSHLGRAELHGFGIFGGSNGYWETELLRQVRLRGTMLTEDIDSSMRVTLRGRRIASDPGLLSHELAPTKLRVLAGQRLRWAQGWSQVSLEYAVSAIRSPRLTVRQKFGTTVLLGWREVYPWLSLQMIPLIAYVLLHPTSEPRNWFAPLLILSTVLTFAAGPTQVAIAYVLAAPEVRQHRSWFFRYALVNTLFYTEFKNTLARVAHVKHFMGEEVWRVTVRDPSFDAAAAALAQERPAVEVTA